MQQLTTKGLVLSRTNYGEADRIITVLSKDQGKLRLIVKGARKPTSRLAGGIELFLISDLTLIRGRSDLATLISARPSRQFGNIIKQIDRLELGYRLIRLINKATEDNAEADYFELLAKALEALDNDNISPGLIELWFEAQLIKLLGRLPDLLVKAAKGYIFDQGSMSFQPEPKGSFSDRDIKFLRLVFSDHSLLTLNRIDGLEPLIARSRSLIQAMIGQVIRL